MRGSGCGSGWDGASSGRTGLRVDATGGAQDGVGCHSRDSIPLLGPSPRGRGCKCRVQSAEAKNADALKRSDPGCEQSGAGDPNVCPGHAKDEHEMTRKRARHKNASWQNGGAKREADRISEVSEQA